MNNDLKDLKQKWLNALRSGEYLQGRGSLSSDNRHCCLGVLCDIIDPSGWSEPRIDSSKHLHFSYKGEFDRYSLPPALSYDLGLADIEDSLAKLNDEGYSFQEIADHIEKNVELRQEKDEE